MTEKEKALELVDKFFYKIHHNGTQEGIALVRDEAKQCALIAVEYILNETRPDEGFVYWGRVKDEINLLC